MDVDQLRCIMGIIAETVMYVENIISVAIHWVLSMICLWFDLRNSWI